MEIVIGFILGIAFLFLVASASTSCLNARDKKIKKLAKYINVCRLNNLKEHIKKAASTSDTVKRNQLLAECLNMIIRIKKDI